MMLTDNYEELFITGLLADETIVDEISGMITPADFADKEVAAVYKIVLNLVDANEFESKAFCDQVLRSKAMPFSRMNELLSNSMLMRQHVRFYAKKVLGESKKRRMISIGQSILADATSDMAAADVAEGAIEQLEKIRSTIEEGYSVSVGNAGRQLLQELSKPRQHRTCETGLYCLDEVLGGLFPGQLIIIGARPGDGKTSMAMQIAKHNADKDRPVSFVSLEMSRLELVSRVICGMTDIPSDRFKALNVDKSDIEKVRSTITDLDASRLTIHDPPSITMRQLAGFAKLQKNRHELDLLVVDYLQLVTPIGKFERRDLEIADITRKLKSLAKELEVPVLLLCQLSRQADGVEPRLSHLRESGSIEQDADVVLFPYRKEKNTFSLIVAKQRSGRHNVEFPVEFDAQKTRFVEPELKTVAFTSRGETVERFQEFG